MASIIRRINYYTFVFIRKIARYFFPVQLAYPIIKIGYASQNHKENISEIVKWYLPKPFTITELSKSRDDHYDQFDLILYDYPKIHFNSNLIRNIHKIAAISSHYYQTAESSNWSSLISYALTDDHKNECRGKFARNIKSIKYDRYKQECWVFGTGPSIESCSDLKINENSLKIICNSIVKNKEFCKLYKPQLIACADPVFHFGHSLYAKQFRADAINLIKSSGAFIVMPEHHAFLFTSHYPEISHKIIGVQFCSTWNLNLDERLGVKHTDNVLSLLLLPLAATFSNTINLLGFDGKSPNHNDYFWKHHARFQYTELMSDVKREHVSFFRDRNFSNYSYTHNKTLSVIFEKLEKNNVKVKSYSKSYLSAINERF